MRSLWILLIAAGSSSVAAADLFVRVDNAPGAGQQVFEGYDSASSFGKLRDPTLEISLPVAGAGVYRLTGSPTGDIALAVYSDTNGNGRLDKSFIGFPSEPLALSNDYRPKGPPSFSRAGFPVGRNETRSLTRSLHSLLGERGRVF